MNATDHTTAAAIATANLATLAHRGTEYVSEKTMTLADTLIHQVREANLYLTALDLDDYTDEQDEAMEGYRLVAEDAYQVVTRTRLRAMEAEAGPAEVY